MKLPSLLLPLAFLFACPGTALLAAAPLVDSASSAHTPAAALAAQPDADAALTWLQEHYPPGSDFSLDIDFLAASSDAFDYPEDTSIRFYVYPAEASTFDGHPLWLAWVGVDEGLIVVLLGSSPASR